jgi:hypothetical protein
MHGDLLRRRLYRGEVPITLNDVDVIADALGVSAAQLLTNAVIDAAGTR